MLPPFTALRSVQTLVDGDKLRIRYGAQDLSPARRRRLHRRRVRADAGQARLRTTCWSGTLSGASTTARTTPSVNAKAMAALRSGITPIVCVGEDLAVRQAGDQRRPHAGPARRRRSSGIERAAGRRRWSSPTSRYGRSAPARWPGRRTRRRRARRSGSGFPRFTAHDVALDMRILYGGSVKPDNIAADHGAASHRRRSGRRGQPRCR